VTGPDGTRTQTETLDVLRSRCSRTLDLYLGMARQGCELLCSVNGLPISEHQRNEILCHRRKELHAHSDYTKARTKLWTFLNRV
jgi:hypothetical protein